jgi:hypothetical protein
MKNLPGIFLYCSLLNSLSSQTKFWLATAALKNLCRELSWAPKHPLSQCTILCPSLTFWSPWSATENLICPRPSQYVLLWESLQRQNQNIKPTGYPLMTVTADPEKQLLHLLFLFFFPFCGTWIWTQDLIHASPPTTHLLFPYSLSINGWKLNSKFPNCCLPYSSIEPAHFQDSVYHRFLVPTLTTTLDAEKSSWPYATEARTMALASARPNSNYGSTSLCVTLCTLLNLSQLQCLYL